MKTIFSLIVAIFLFSVSANAADVLLYTGAGASAGDVTDIKSQIRGAGLTYATATAPQVNAMTRTQLASYKLIVWPGGNSITMSRALTYTAAANIRNAVTVDGVSYLGICAGAFMAQRSTLYNSFALATTYFNFYSQGGIFTTPIYFPLRSPMSVVYWDGPQLSGFGKVVAKYPNGLPAIAENFVGRGLVILAGVHPEATPYWGVSGYSWSSTSTANSYTKTLILAAYRKSMLPYYN
jgi:glutamine amidotransferase-like uncharacterized protein